MKEVKKLVLFNLIFIIGLALFTLGIYRNIPSPTPSPYVKTLDDVTQQSISLASDMNQFLTTAALGIIGVLGSIMIGNSKTELRENLFTGIVFFLSIVFALASLCYGYLIYRNAFEIIAYHVIDIHQSNIELFQAWQFRTVVSSVVLFALYVFNVYLSRSIKNKK